MSKSAMPSEIPIKNLVLEALEIIERIYWSADQKKVSAGPQRDCARQDYTVIKELQGKGNRKLTRGLFKVVWEMSVQRSYPVVLMARRFEPSVLLMNVLCAASGVSPRDVFRGHMWEEDFPVLTQNCLRIITAPIRVWVTPQVARFDVVLADARSKAGHVIALCDWCLEDAEWGDAMNLSAVGDVTFFDANGP